MEGMFCRVVVNLLGPVDQNYRGKVYDMVVVEHFSKFAILIPLPNKEARPTDAFAQRILGAFSSCAEVMSD